MRPAIQASISTAGAPSARASRSMSRLHGAAHRPCISRVVRHERSTVNLVRAVYLCGTEHRGVVQFLMAVSSRLGHLVKAEPLNHASIRKPPWGRHRAR